MIPLAFILVALAIAVTIISVFIVAGLDEGKSNCKICGKFVLPGQQYRWASRSNYPLHEHCQLKSIKELAKSSRSMGLLLAKEELQYKEATGRTLL